MSIKSLILLKYAQTTRIKAKREKIIITNIYVQSTAIKQYISIKPEYIKILSDLAYNLHSSNLRLILSIILFNGNSYSF